jgi:hypothetical protein
LGRNSRSSGYASNPSRSKSTKTASVDTTELRCEPCGIGGKGWGVSVALGRNSRSSG